MAYELRDVESFAEDADGDGRAESLGLIFPDRTLVCLSDNDGDGLVDWAAVDINLTKMVNLAVRRNGDLIEVQVRDTEGNPYHEPFDHAEFADTFPGWARLLNMRFPGGEPINANVNETLAVVNELLLPDWTGRRIPWKEGALYAIPDGEGAVGVVKVLKVDTIGVHIRQYSNVFDQPPVRVDESELFLAPFDNDSGHPVGMGHLPLSARTFRGWSPRFIQQSIVQADELAGYEGWQEAEGGYF